VKPKKHSVVEPRTANIAALLCALAVLVAGAIMFASIGPAFEAPTKTTTVVEASTGPGVGKRTKTTERNTPSPSPASEKTTTTVEAPKGSPSGKKTTTTEASQRSFTERILGHSGIVLLQIGVILLAAFLAGAFVQRVLLGDFALKIGGILELSAAQSVEGTAEDLTAKVAANTEALAALQKLDPAVKDMSLKLVDVGSLLVQLSTRVMELEAKLGGRDE
jgi:flagellin-like hook-associated protein FlgL